MQLFYLSTIKTPGAFILPLLIMLTAVQISFAQWELIWSDEFDYTGLPEKTKWGYDVGTGSNGWGNQELQYYTKDSLKNARVENGNLIITARKEKLQSSNYTSVRLISKNKGDWLYGKFEIAAKLPTGKGLWPAIWMLPTDWEYGNWPKSGELDIMENVGFDPFMVHFNIHTEAYNHSIGTNKGASVKLDDPHTKFNVYAMEWYTDSIVFFANGARTFTFKNEKTGSAVWPFDKRFHLLLNIAVGGSWGGQQGVDTTIFPKEMIIDYVRVYRQSTANTVNHSPRLAAPVPVITYKAGEVRLKGGSVRNLRIVTLDGSIIANFTKKHITADGQVLCPLAPGIYHAVYKKENGARSNQVLLVR